LIVSIGTYCNIVRTLQQFYFEKKLKISLNIFFLLFIDESIVLNLSVVYFLVQDERRAVRRGDEVPDGLAAGAGHLQQPAGPGAHLANAGVAHGDVRGDGRPHRAAVRRLRGASQGARGPAHLLRKAERAAHLHQGITVCLLYFILFYFFTVPFVCLFVQH
jgi:hypothetical protein